jgi:hypothetical protein
MAAIMATRTVRNAGAIASYVRVALWLQQFGKKALLLRQPDNPVGNARLRKSLWNAGSQRRPTRSVWLRQYYERLRAAGKPGKVPSSQLCEGCSRRSGARLLVGDPSSRPLFQSVRLAAQFLTHPAVSSGHPNGQVPSISV